MVAISSVILLECQCLNIDRPILRHLTLYFSFYGYWLVVGNSVARLIISEPIVFLLDEFVIVPTDPARISIPGTLVVQNHSILLFSVNY